MSVMGEFNPVREFNGLMDNYFQDRRVPWAGGPGNVTPPPPPDVVVPVGLERALAGVLGGFGVDESYAAGFVESLVDDGVFDE